MGGGGYPRHCLFLLNYIGLNILLTHELQEITPMNYKN